LSLGRCLSILTCCMLHPACCPLQSDTTPSHTGSTRDGVFEGWLCMRREYSAIDYKRDRCRMSSIIRAGDTFHGVGVAGRGVFASDTYGRRTYAGQCKDGHACGLGVLTTSYGSKVYAEHGPGGQYDGRCFDRWAVGDTYYRLFERGERKESARVSADGTCGYNGEDCAPDDRRLLALIAQVAPVEVRLATPPPPRHLVTTRR
jgi:hypothetical protein